LAADEKPGVILHAAFLPDRRGSDRPGIGCGSPVNGTMEDYSEARKIPRFRDERMDCRRLTLIEERRRRKVTGSLSEPYSIDRRNIFRLTLPIYKGLETPMDSVPLTVPFLQQFLLRVADWVN
jgi:hypothetical protein